MAGLEPDAAHSLGTGAARDGDASSRSCGTSPASALERPFRLDSPRPVIPLKDYAYNELRYRALADADPGTAAELLAKAQQVVTEKYRQYEELAARGGECFHPDCSRCGADATRAVEAIREISDAAGQVAPT